MVLKWILASKLSELGQFENRAEKLPDSKEKNENEAKIKPMPFPSSLEF